MSTMSTIPLTGQSEWIKGLLAVPFVLYSQPHGVCDGQGMSSLARAREEAHRRYSEILRDVEGMIDDHSKQSDHPPSQMCPRPA